jgi:prevent-host-death family protein
MGGMRRALQSMTAAEAKNEFGRLIDLARAEPVVVTKHSREVVVVLAIEEFRRLRAAARRSKQPGSAKAG